MIVIAALAGFSLFSALITYGLGVFVYAQKTTSHIHRLFLAMTLAATYWALGEFFIWQAVDYAESLFWLKASSFWTITIALAVHFIISYTDAIPSRGRQRAILVGSSLYLPAVLFSLIEIFTGWIYVVTYEPGAGYVYLPVLTNPVCWIMLVYYFLIMVWAFFASYLSWRRVPEGTIRRQNCLVCIGIAAVIIFGSLSGGVLPVLGIHVPNMVFIGIVIFSVLIAYAIRRYGLFVLSPENAVMDILRTMPDGMVLTDRDERIIAGNRSLMEIFPDIETDYCGRTFSSLIGTDAFESIREAIGADRRVSDFEVILQNGEPRIISITGSIVLDQDEEPVGSVFILRDISDRKASETALRIANEKLSLLSQLTRHDISNLVTALYGYLTFLEEDRSSEASGRYVSLSLDIVDKIILHLRFSREYQEIGVKRPVWQRLETMIDRAASGLPYEVDIRVSVAAVEIYADPLVEKVMYNILENAVRHGESVTNVLITTDEQADGTLVLAFEDDGTGVSDHEKETIFAFGYGKNTGFGLAFSREILSVTGIKIFETGTYGKGARFEIRVPRTGWRPPE